MASEAEVRRWVGAGRILAESTLDGSWLHHCGRCRQVLGPPWPDTCPRCGLAFAAQGEVGEAEPDLDGLPLHCPTCGQGYDDQHRVRCRRCSCLLPQTPRRAPEITAEDARVRLGELKAVRRARPLTADELVDVASCYRSLGDQAQAGRAVAALAAMHGAGVTAPPAAARDKAQRDGPDPAVADASEEAGELDQQPDPEVVLMVRAILLALVCFGLAAGTDVLLGSTSALNGRAEALQATRVSTACTFRFGFIGILAAAAAVLIRLDLWEGSAPSWCAVWAALVGFHGVFFPSPGGGLAARVLGFLALILALGVVSLAVAAARAMYGGPMSLGFWEGLRRVRESTNRDAPEAVPGSPSWPTGAGPGSGRRRSGAIGYVAAGVLIVLLVSGLGLRSYLKQAKQQEQARVAAAAAAEQQAEAERQAQLEAQRRAQPAAAPVSFVGYCVECGAAIRGEADVGSQTGAGGIWCKRCAAQSAAVVANQVALSDAMEEARRARQELEYLKRTGAPPHVIAAKEREIEAIRARLTQHYEALRPR